MGTSCTQPSPVDHTLTIALNGTDKCVNNHSHCSHLLILKQILQLYNDWQSYIEQQNAKQNTVDDTSVSVLEYINNAIVTDDENENNNTGCSIVSILQHFHHLIDHHTAHFEAIYNTFRETNNCDMSSCNMITRNHRDRGREQNSRTRAECYHKRSDSREVIAQQILDQIHCYIFHTFDMGFALTKQEKIDILKEEEEEESKDDIKLAEHRGRERERIARVIQSKKKQIRELRNRVGHGVSLDDNNKFMSNIDMDQTEEMHQTQDNMFSFGVRYYYNDKYKDNHELDAVYNKGYTYDHWFVDKQHKNLKTELLSNKKQCINKAQYRDLYYKSEEYLKTDHIRSNCRKMCVEHLLCIMVYCNFDTFQAEFSKTYRHHVDDDDDMLKLRHSEFANFAETLQNAVELNGTMVDNGTVKAFYHGINQELMFTSTLHQFYGPISTSSEYEVAMVFTQNNGIILELMDGTLYTDEQNSIYFDCERISDFGYEKEKLFVSTKVPLKIASIFHVRLNENYAKYIELITILLSIIEGDVALNTKKELTTKNVKAIVKLLKHELAEAVIDEMPQYISKLLHHICLNIERFTATYSSTFASNKNNYYHKYKSFAKFLCCDDCEFFKLDVLCKLFPNLTSIAIKCSLLTDKVCDDILQFLKKESKLNNIVFQLPVRASVSFSNLKNKYEALFEGIDWCIEIENKEKRFMIYAKKKAVHDRTASTNVIYAKRIFSATELVTMTQSVDAFMED